MEKIWAERALLPEGWAENVCITLDQGRIGVGEQSAFVPGRHVITAGEVEVGVLIQPIGDVSGRPVAPDQSFEQRSGREPVGAVQPGATDFSGCV